LNEATKIYPNRDSLKSSIRIGNPNLSEELVSELSFLWGREYGDNGEMQLKHDHAHRYMNPIRYNFDDVVALWREVTATVGIVMADESPFYHKYQKINRIEQAYEYLPASPTHFYLIKNAAHMLHIEQPQQVSEVVSQFFI